MPSQPDATEVYQLLILRRDAREILLSPRDAGWALPRVQIARYQRMAEQLTETIAKSFGLQVCCLFVSSAEASNETNPSTTLATAVLECVKQSEKAPGGTCWVPTPVATHCIGAQDGAEIQGILGELAAYVAGEKPGPFAKPGWFRELFRWAYEQTAPLGLRFTGNFRQLNASPTFSLIRMETDRGALWFKATGEPNAHELPVTLLLTDFFPEHLPRILSVHTPWNGWLSAEVEGKPLDELTDCPAWERAAESLAELQIKSIGKSADLFAAGCKDLRLCQAEGLIEPFLGRISEFMRFQEKHPLRHLAAQNFVRLAKDCVNPSRCSAACSCRIHWGTSTAIPEI
jgi:hypothetical protein